MLANAHFFKIKSALFGARGLLQVLCSREDKVIVKDYNYLRQGNTTKTKVEIQFDVNYVLDDSFLSRANRQRMEESQRSMFKILGKPCVERALSGHNSTVSDILFRKLSLKSLQGVD